MYAYTYIYLYIYVYIYIYIRRVPRVYHIVRMPIALSCGWPEVSVFIRLFVPWREKTAIHSTMLCSVLRLGSGAAIRASSRCSFLCFGYLPDVLDDRSHCRRPHACGTHCRFARKLSLHRSAGKLRLCQEVALKCAPVRCAREHASGNRRVVRKLAADHDGGYLQPPYDNISTNFVK